MPRLPPPPVLHADNNTADSKYQHKKQLSAIHQALHNINGTQEQHADIAALRQLATYSFLTSAYRQQIWPVISADNESTKATVIPTRSSYPNTQPHTYSTQIDKDIARSMHHFDVCKKWKKQTREMYRQRLHNIMHTLFNSYPQLHYIQGYHDIVSVIVLTIADEYTAYVVCVHLSLTHLTQILQPSLHSLLHTLAFIFPLLSLLDPPLHRLLTHTRVQSFVTLSWILTWFSHNVTRFTIVQHLFDFFMSHASIMPMYMVTALIMLHREQLLSTHKQNSGSTTSGTSGGSGEEAEEGDPSRIHLFFQTVEVTTEAEATWLCEMSSYLYQHYPPKILQQYVMEDSDVEKRERQAAAQREWKQHKQSANKQEHKMSWWLPVGVGVALCGVILAAVITGRHKFYT